MHTEIVSIGPTDQPCLETVPGETNAPPRLTIKASAILVIEDEEILRLLIEDLLQGKGYRPIMACNGQEALSIYSRESGIAMVLTDMMMPVMDGHQTISALRHINPGLKIIAMSGSLEAAANLPKNVPFLAKPLNPDLFLRTIEAALAANSG